MKKFSQIMLCLAVVIIAFVSIKTNVKAGEKKPIVKTFIFSRLSSKVVSPYFPVRFTDFYAVTDTLYSVPGTTDTYYFGLGFYLVSNSGLTYTATDTPDALTIEGVADGGATFSGTIARYTQTVHSTEFTTTNAGSAGMTSVSPNKIGSTMIILDQLN